MNYLENYARRRDTGPAHKPSPNTARRFSYLLHLIVMCLVLGSDQGVAHYARGLISTRCQFADLASDSPNLASRALARRLLWLRSEKSAPKRLFMRGWLLAILRILSCHRRRRIPKEAGLTGPAEGFIF